MKKNKIIGLAGVVAILLSGCGGDTGGASSTTVLASSMSSSSAARVAAPTKWANVKFGGGGYVPGLIFHPTSPDVLYARTDMGGAYRWDAANAAWVPITDGFGAADTFYHGSETMALDPNDDKRVYMSTGMYLSDKADARLYISTDRGDNWTYVNLPFSAASNAQGRAIGERLMVDPNQPEILFYGTRTTGLWRAPTAARPGSSWARCHRTR
jgi:hypothetical protein